MFDVAIIGAGVAGCTAAIALAATHRVVLIDKQAEPPERIGESLAPAARRIFHQLGLLAEFNQQPHLLSQGMQSYWGSEQVQVVDNIRNPDGFGWHLNRQLFEAFLREFARLRGVECRWPVKLTASYYDQDHWCLTTDSCGYIKAKFVIDAGGRQAPFARQQGMQREHINKLIACWATIPDESTNRMGLIASTDIGWWYSVVTPNNRRVITLQTDSDLIDAEIKKDLIRFIQLALCSPPMAQLLHGLDFTAKADGAVYHGVTAANTTRLQQVAGICWAALGDAAISFDPLSSQGIFNAMASAMQLADLLRSQKEVQAEYTKQIEQIWQYYVIHKNAYYRQENRWRDALFWGRRHLANVVGH